MIQYVRCCFFVVFVSAVVWSYFTIFTWIEVRRLAINVETKINFGQLIKNTTSFGFQDQLDTVQPTMAFESQSQLLTELVDVTSIHPAAFENLWIEINRPDTLIRRTAFLDNRTSTGPAVVIITLHNETIVEQLKLFAKIVMPDGAVFCQKIEDWQQVPPKLRHMKDLRDGPDDHRCHLLRINLRKLKYKEPPSYIAISKNETCNNLLPPMPVFHDHVKKGKFAVCLHKGIFGYVSPELLVQFVEINRILGASSITLYIQKAPETLYTFMLPYIKSGLVELLDWKVSVTMRNYGQNAVNNECFYRNIHRAEYLALHDIDELMVPQMHKSWHEMFDYVANKQKINLSKYASIHVKRVMWRLGKDPLIIPETFNCSRKNVPYYFKMTDKAKEIKGMYPKIFVSLERSTALRTHSVASYVRNVTSEHILLQPDVCLCHHYREFKDVKHNFTFSHNSFMERFVERVMPGISKQLCT